MQRQAGFTLIELLIVMVVLSVLAAIAIPNYTDYVRRGKLPEATSNLQAMKTKMEQYFQDNRVYPGACVTGTPAAGQIQIPTLTYFTITCSNLGAQTYTVSAAGITGGDLDGITFSIDQANARKTQITSGSNMAKHGYSNPPTNCWVTKKPNLC